VVNALTRGAAAALAALALSAPAAATAPRPDPQGEAAILVERAAGDVLFEEGADERHAIASATKLMTALLTLERARLDDVFPAAAYQAGSVESQINLRRGERMTVDDLLVALLLESANDAAATLAENISGSRAAFVDDMNRRAAELGLDNTHYANPIGFDDAANYSSARDLAALARTLMRNRRFAQIVDMPRATLRSGARVRTIDTRNKLVMRVPMVDGIKTGHTGSAGYVLVGSAHRRGARVISVLLGAPSESARDTESLELLRYGLGLFRRVRALRGGAELASVDVENRGEDAALTTPRTIALTIRRGERVERRLDAPDELEGPLPAGRRVGTVELVYRGRVVRRAPLVTAEAVPEAGTGRKVWSALDTVLIAIGLVLGGIAVPLTVLRMRANRLRRARRAPGK
jgi:D-alanyl-D-alanine carboxypeptidase (penicillin-binding protein 5/6)